MSTVNKCASTVYSKIGEELYLKSELADVHFVFKVADGVFERIPAHKLLLKSVSDVFHTMFNETWREKVEVEIVDTSVVEFKEFLQFFYFEQVTVTTENISKVMYLGDKYNVAGCMSVCEQFLISSLDDGNLFQNYELGIFFNQPKLKKYCESVIAVDTKKVLASGNFMVCDRKVLSHILNIDTLSCTEAELFEACMEWTKTAANVDNLTRQDVNRQLGNLLYQIRFKSMTLQQFGTLIPSYGSLFSADEYKDISQSTVMPDFESNIFSNNKRTPFENRQWNEEEKIECNRLLSLGFSTNPYYIKNIEKTTFSVNKPMILKKIRCCRISEYKSNVYFLMKELPTEIKIVQINESVPSNEKCVLYDGNTLLNSWESTCINLQKLIVVKPGFMYEVQLKQTPPPNCCTGSLLKSEIDMDPIINVQFHQDPIDPVDKVPRGTILALQFYRI
ncbi:BTB/POZ domain-containing protein 3-like [Contarinia nasturtii]|uniref:BTB/POZ domain-containing protein 3-like n=1 Tax=Contarinia nasturtii TaxID=265458 RepID=UPI0012D3BD50|nr:BTB/POZ domain-containing protein 3-like [Contarinia nasturtii]